MPIRLSILPLVAGALLATGCSGSGPKVTGKVMFNGAPVEGANVTFIGDSSDPKQPGDAFSGKTDSNGRFTLVIPKGGSIKPATYKVTVVKLVPKAGAKIPEGIDDPNALISMRAATNALPPMYASVASTPLKADLKSGDTDVPAFNLEGDKPPGTP
jgi:Domain of unknown function (DUF4198)